MDNELTYIIHKASLMTKLIIDVLWNSKADLERHQEIIIQTRKMTVSQNQNQNSGLLTSYYPYYHYFFFLNWQHTKHTQFNVLFKQLEWTYNLGHETAWFLSQRNISSNYFYQFTQPCIKMCICKKTYIHICKNKLTFKIKDHCY